MRWRIPTQLLERLDIIVEGETAEDAVSNFNNGQWLNEPNSITSDWEALGPPEEID